MKIIKKTLDSRTTKADVLIIFGCVGKKIKLPSGVELPKGAVEGADLDFGQFRITDTVGGPFQQVILVGLGNMKNVDCEKVRRSSAIAINETKKQKKQ